MRLLIAMMKHETNTFSPVPTPLARFGPWAGAALWRCGDPGLSRHRIGSRGLSRSGRARRGGGGRADRRRCAAEPCGRGCRLRAHGRHYLRRRRKGRVRRHHARPARCDGDREFRGRRGRTLRRIRAIDSTPRSPCRSTCTQTSTTRSSTTPRSSPATAPTRISTPTRPPCAPARSCCGRYRGEGGR